MKSDTTVSEEIYKWCEFVLGLEADSDCLLAAKRLDADPTSEQIFLLLSSGVN